MKSEKQHKKFRRSIALAKQKIIFYLSYLKSQGKSGEFYWQPEKLGIKDFVKVFASDKLYQRINKEEREKLKAQISHWKGK